MNTMLQDIIANRKLITVLAVNELKSRYLGTFAGFVWGIINPTMMALIYWFVFSTIFYSGKVKFEGYDLPYICYFLAGYAPWMLFSECVSRNLNTIADNPNYVKKIVFPLQIFAPIHYVANTVAHLVMLCVLFFIMFYNNMPITWSVLYLIPYYLALAAFTFGISWAVSALNVFVRDTAQVVPIILNIWFWLSPVVWVMSAMPSSDYSGLFAMNPFLFFIDGYRWALFGTAAGSDVGNTTFWVDLLIIALVFFAGKALFHRLKPHFGDMA